MICKLGGPVQTRFSEMVILDVAIFQATFVCSVTFNQKALIMLTGCWQQTNVS